jgi:hypothetical protein
MSPFKKLPHGWRKLAAAALRAGWRIERTQGGHFKWSPPIGRIIYTSSTPSDHRAMRNVRADLKREGLQV